jgi:hypothetical protein
LRWLECKLVKMLENSLPSSMISRWSNGLFESGVFFMNWTPMSSISLMLILRYLVGINIKISDIRMNSKYINQSFSTHTYLYDQIKPRLFRKIWVRIAAPVSLIYQQVRFSQYNTPVINLCRVEDKLPSSNSRWAKA